MIKGGEWPQGRGSIKIEEEEQEKENSERKSLFSSLESLFVHRETDFPSIKVFIYSFFTFNYMSDLLIVIISLFDNKLVVHIVDAHFLQAQ